MPRKLNPWPAELLDRLDKILADSDYLISVSDIGLRALSRGNPVSVRVVILEHLLDAIEQIEKNIELIINHYENNKSGGAPYKWVTTTREIQDKHLYNLYIYQQRLTECYQDANWPCVELYLKNLPYLCYNIRELIEAIPREAYILEESREIIRKALGRDN